ncbi:MAG: hypothetical protein ABI369_03725 [Acetobacteraceae bacterium]
MEGDGRTHVSTGRPNRYGYYITPTGVFTHDSSILDYRAPGTYNKNHVRGLGVKGMRVWDFGWQSAAKGWLDSGERGDIRLLMHATDPANLARRIAESSRTWSAGRPSGRGPSRRGGRRAAAGTPRPPSPPPPPPGPPPSSAPARW